MATCEGLCKQSFALVCMHRRCRFACQILLCVLDGLQNYAARTVFCALDESEHVLLRASQQSDIAPADANRVSLHMLRQRQGLLASNDLSILFTRHSPETLLGGGCTCRVVDIAGVDACKRAAQQNMARGQLASRRKRPGSDSCSCTEVMCKLVHLQL